MTAVPTQHDVADEPRATAWFAGPFFASFLGLAATRVWLQFSVYGSYVQSDNGLFTFVSNLFYGAALFVAAAVFSRRAPSRKTADGIAWTAFALMTVSALCFLLSDALDSPAILWATCAVSGITSAFAGGMWVAPYLRLGVRQAILYGFASLALGSLGGFVLGLLPITFGHYVNVLMGAVAFLCYRRTTAVQPNGFASPEPVYDTEPKSTVALLIGGIVVFGLALGLSRGFPSGESVDLSVGMRALHQLGTVAISFAIIWAVGLRRRQLSFALLWRVEFVLLACSVAVLAMMPGTLTEFAIAVTNLADTMMLGIMWTMCQDASRHSSVNPYTLFGCVWGARILSRAAGRILIVGIGVTSQAANIAVGILVFALSISMVLLLSDKIPRKRPLFAYDDRDSHDVPTAASEPHAESLTDPTDQDEAAAIVPELAPEFASEPQTIGLEQLKEAYGLTEREAEVALLIGQGRSKANIAQKLFISENTVRTHSKNAYAKMGIHTRDELMDLLNSGHLD